MNKVLFPNIAWILILLVPIVFIGFYPSYFSGLSTNMPSIFHVHAFFMLCWVAMAVSQPLLIKLKKTKTHRLIGKISYFVMPLVFLTAYLMIRDKYYQVFESQTAAAVSGTEIRSAEEIQSNAAAITMIGMVYLTWLIVFYLLAVANRKKLLFHATYMFGAILTLLGPSVDRLIGNTFTYFNWPFTFFVVNFVFFFNIAFLTSLLIYQRVKGNSIKPATISIAIYIAGIAAFFFLPGTGAWQSFIDLIM